MDIRTKINITCQKNWLCRYFIKSTRIHQILGRRRVANGKASRQGANCPTHTTGGCRVQGCFLRTGRGSARVPVAVSCGFVFPDSWHKTSQRLVFRLILRLHPHLFSRTESRLKDSFGSLERSLLELVSIHRRLAPRLIQSLDKHTGSKKFNPLWSSIFLCS